MQESGSISGAGGAAFDFAFFHQAVIVVHHQVAFNLCERVEHNANKDQQRCAAEELGEVLAHAEQAGESG